MLQHCKYCKKSSATGCYTRTILRATSYHCKLALHIDQCNTTLRGPSLAYTFGYSGYNFAHRLATWQERNPPLFYSPNVWSSKIAYDEPSPYRVSGQLFYYSFTLPWNVALRMGVANRMRLYGVMWLLRPDSDRSMFIWLSLELNPVSNLVYMNGFRETA